LNRFLSICRFLTCIKKRIFYRKKQTVYLDKTGMPYYLCNSFQGIKGKKILFLKI